MDIKKIITLCLTSIIFINLPIVVYAQYKRYTKGDLVLEYESKSEIAIILHKITNKGAKSYDLTIIAGDDNNRLELDGITLNSGETHTFEKGLECNTILLHNGSGIWTRPNTRNAWAEYQKSLQPVEVEKPAEKEVVTQKVEVAPNVKQPERKESKAQKQQETKKSSTINSKQIVENFQSKLKNDSFYSQKNIQDKEKDINNYISNIEGWQDKKKYIEDNNLIYYIRQELNDIYTHLDDVDDYTSKYLSQYKNYKIEDTFNHQDSLKSILLQRIETRKANINKLNDTIKSVSEKAIDISKLDKKTIAIIGGGALIIVILCVVIITLSKRKKRPAISQENTQPQPTTEASSAIVIRKTTTTILKKQNLDNVINNTTYFNIDTADFCDDSAVKHIYIKNTCIKDIYNMYADDLRNPNNPKEDGCMVLGRWVLNEATGKYSVSLEEIVRPGDDAVFKEYELNFGGKIKLRVAERLRKLRNETNLQYDLTCWVHSHPGLGVFFSNFDTSVQTQLKHSTHPNFLIAIVVDILTPQQELGIFTYKSDSSINSRNDIKKMYSLEELHKWAVESDRNSYKTEDCYNILSKAKQLSNACQGIQLSNGAIIDISSLTTEQNSGLIGWAHGFKTECKDKTEYVVNSVSKEERVVDNELLGCLIAGTHRSIPSIKKAISESIDHIKFVMFYSEKEGVLTTIPIVNKQLITEEEYYSEETLEDLKIWTRRKR